jgi:hypothetical protein
MVLAISRRARVSLGSQSDSVQYGNRAGAIACAGKGELGAMTSRWLPYTAVAAIVAGMIGALAWMGRLAICKCGYVKLWHGVVFSSENSQHLTDWYSVTHVTHGLLFYFVTFLLLRRFSLGWRLAAATFVECAWEVVENTDAIIGRYREVTISLDYFGDSIVNSTADVGAMILGFFLAARLPVAASVATAALFEGFLAWQIRDNLALNVLMLLWPLEPVAKWQAGG